MNHSERRSPPRDEAALKGEMAVFGREELDAFRTGKQREAEDQRAHQKRLVQFGQLLRERKRPCLISSISLGGARVALNPPAPLPGQAILLDVGLGPGEVVHNVAGSVVECSTGVGEFPIRTRLQFENLSAETEAQLVRAIDAVQQETPPERVPDNR